MEFHRDGDRMEKLRAEAGSCGRECPGRGTGREAQRTGKRDLQVGCGSPSPHLVPDRAKPDYRASGAGIRSRASRPRVSVGLAAGKWGNRPARRGGLVCGAKALDHKRSGSALSTATPVCYRLGLALMYAAADAQPADRAVGPAQHVAGGVFEAGIHDQQPVCLAADD